MVVVHTRLLFEQIVLSSSTRCVGQIAREWQSACTWPDSPLNGLLHAFFSDSDIGGWWVASIHHLYILALLLFRIDRPRRPALRSPSRLLWDIDRLKDFVCMSFRLFGCAPMSHWASEASFFKQMSSTATATMILFGILSWNRENRKRFYTSVSTGAFATSRCGNSCRTRWTSSTSIFAEIVSCSFHTNHSVLSWAHPQELTVMRSNDRTLLLSRASGCH